VIIPFIAKPLDNKLDKEFHKGTRKSSTNTANYLKNLWNICYLASVLRPLVVLPILDYFT